MRGFNAEFLRAAGGRSVCVLAVSWIGAAAAFAQTADPLPVREATVFKDGHAFVLQRGSVAVGAGGEVVLDRLPSPTLGTFWAFSGDPKVKLVSAVSGRKRISVERTALDLPELLRANTGKRAMITEISGKDAETTYEAKIAGVAERSAEELDRTNPPGSDPALPLRGGIVLFETGIGTPQAGTKAVPLTRILNVTFLDAPAAKVGSEEFRNSLTLKLDGVAQGATADIGLAYLQLGLRWIPNYRVTLGDDGNATVELRATLINELADLNDVKLNLAVGVPSFKFEGDPDPISMQSAALRLASAAGANSNFRNLNNFSNAIMSQQQVAGPQSGGDDGQSVDLGPAVEGPGRAEDLFLFPLEHITLKKSERMSVALATATMPFEDIYTVDLPMAPPPEALRQLNSDEQREMARLQAVPKAIHKARLDNRGPQPLTTAPALIMKNGTPLGQGLMTYAPAGAKADLEITTALGIQASVDENEAGRTPNAIRMNNSDFSRVNLKGSLHLKSFLEKPAKLIVTRYAIGAFDTASGEGKLTNGSPFDQALMLAAAGSSTWRASDYLPSWWASVNGLGKAQWTLDLDPGKETALEYQWHYFWR